MRQGRMEQDTKNRIIGILVLAAASLGIILAAFLLKHRKDRSTCTEYGFSMGSAVTVTFYGDPDTAGRAAGQAIETIKALDEQVLSRRIEGSETEVWNRTAVTGEGVEISETLAEAVRGGIRLWKDSGGVLDLTLRPVLDVWGIEDGSAETFVLPDEEDLKAAAEDTGMEGLTLSGNLLQKDKDRLTIDLGAVGKGYALDMIYRTCVKASDENTAEDTSKPSGGLVIVGGSIMVFGSKADGSDFRVGIRDPEGLPEDILGVISFPSGTGKTCISTSGAYEKYIEKDGVRYHHIIDPFSLRPAETDLVSVTIICENGLYSDGLSTACFILGEERGIALAEAYGAECVLIRKDGTTYVSPGLEGQVEWK